MCQHTGKTYEYTETKNGMTMHLYVCHDCQESIYSMIPPTKDDRWRDDTNFDWE